VGQRPSDLIIEYLS